MNLQAGWGWGGGGVAPEHPLIPGAVKSGGQRYQTDPPMSRPSSELPGSSKRKKRETDRVKSESRKRREEKKKAQAVSTETSRRGCSTQIQAQLQEADGPPFESDG